MEIIKKYGDFCDDTIKMGICCIAEDGEVFFAIPGMEFNGNNQVEIYEECIRRINNFYKIKVISLNTFIKDRTGYIRIVAK